MWVRSSEPCFPKTSAHKDHFLSRSLAVRLSFSLCNTLSFITRFILYFTWFSSSWVTRNARLRFMIRQLSVSSLFCKDEHIKPCQALWTTRKSSSCRRIITKTIINIFSSSSRRNTVRIHLFWGRCMSNTIRKFNKLGSLG